jgi:hypothetical protein
MFEFDNGINRITGWQKIRPKEGKGSKCLANTNIPGAVIGPMEA